MENTINSSGEKPKGNMIQNENREDEATTENSPINNEKPIIKKSEEKTNTQQNGITEEELKANDNK